MKYLYLITGNIHFRRFLSKFLTDKARKQYEILLGNKLGNTRTEFEFLSADFNKNALLQTVFFGDFSHWVQEASNKLTLGLNPISK